MPVLVVDVARGQLVPVLVRLKTWVDLLLLHSLLIEATGAHFVHEALIVIISAALVRNLALALPVLELLEIL